ARQLRVGGIDPARQCPARRRARCRDAADRNDRRIRQHPRAERARPARRVREGSCGRSRILRAVCRVCGRQGKGRVSDAATGLPPPAASEQTFLERILNGVERAGNKMPHPAILFLALCGAVIVLSQVLYWFDVKATFQVVQPPAVATEQVYYGGSVEPTDVGPTVPEPAKDYKLTTATRH